MQVECITDAAVFDQLADEWEELLEEAVTRTTFLRPLWQKAWWGAYGEGKELALLTARGDAGELLGVAPLFVHDLVVDGDGLLPRLSIERPLGPSEGRVRRVVHPIGGSEVSDYLDLIVAKSHAQEVYQALWGDLLNRSDWELMDLHCLPAGSPILEALPKLAEASGRPVKVAQEEVCPFIDLPEDWEAYLSSLDKKQRHEIRRKIRKAHRQARVEWRRARDEESLEDDLALFFSLHESSDPSKAAFWNPETRAFFHEITWALFRDGSLELSFMYYNDTPVASLYCFTDNGALLVYNSGYEPEIYRPLSSGLVLTSRVIQYAIEQGLQEFDFLRGDERYKYDFGGVDRQIFRMGIAREAGS